MSKFYDHTGERFGRLVVLGRAGTSPDKQKTWLCQCDCGNTSIVRGGHLRTGSTSSCGCLVTKHGMYRSREYATWRSMVQRCTNPKDTNYPHYGARGISVCNRWRESFEAFLADVGARPAGMSLDRFPDMNGNYEPGNVRWATAAEQAHNRRRSPTAETVEQIRSLRTAGLSQQAVADRLGIAQMVVSNIERGEHWLTRKPAADQAA